MLVSGSTESLPSLPSLSLPSLPCASHSACATVCPAFVVSISARNLSPMLRARCRRLPLWRSYTAAPLARLPRLAVPPLARPATAAPGAAAARVVPVAVAGRCRRRFSAPMVALYTLVGRCRARRAPMVTDMAPAGSPPRHSARATASAPLEEVDGRRECVRAVAVERRVLVGAAV